MLNPLISKCPICGKEFEPTGEWAYRKGSAILCSWHCLREMEKMKKGTTKVEYTYNGVTKTLKEWAKDLGVSYNTLYQRLYRGKIKEVFEREGK